MFSLRHLIVGYLIVAAVFLLDRGDFFRSWNDRLQDFRAAHSEIDASGSFVFVAIDTASLRDVGTWPWSRQVHAVILHNLTAAGAIDVFFDVDFAFASDPVGDAAFAEALDQSGNAFLPVFRQNESVTRSDETTNRPHSLFADRSWPALVNVMSDERGVVRYYPYGQEIDGEYIPSVAAVLTGAFAERPGHFPINFAFRPGSVPVVSAVDIASGRFDPEIIAGRSVIVGASAIELGDLFAVPVHGIVPGPLIHALAAETLLAGRVPAPLSVDWLFLFLLLFLPVLTCKLFRNPAVLIPTAAIVLVASEAAALAAFAGSAIVVPTAVLHPTLGGYCLWSVLRRLQQNRRVIDRQRQEVANTSARLQQVFADSFDAIAILDEAGNIQMHSDVAASLFGFDAAGRLRLPQRLIDDARRSMGGAPDRSLRQYDMIEPSRTLHLEYTVTPSETIVTVAGRRRQVRIATLSIRDVTRIREQEREIAYLSSYDELTGALRRNIYLEFLDLRAQAGEPFTVVVFNLSRFKTINVVLGRDIGDALLRHVVERLENAGLNISATSRLGADTFACHSEFPTSADEAAALACRIRDAIVEPYALEDAKARVGVRVGYSIARGGAGFNAAESLSQAEEALDAARLANENEPRRYDPVLSSQQFRSREIERALGRALDREEFELWYQPQHRLDDLGLIGAEALIRWTSGTLGPIFPDQFIEIAESSGFINELGAWVLQRAVEDTLALPGDLSVAVNVSGIQMLGEGIVGDLDRLLTETRIAPARLCLELTETVLFGGNGEHVEQMRDIRFRGVTWALDDFGTGYSSLGYLSKLPIDKLKVDKSFMLGLGTDAYAAPILRAVGDLCRGLGIRLLCEGVETEDHLRFAREHRYAEAQGYLFSKPLAFEAYRAYVERHTLPQARIANRGH